RASDHRETAVPTAVREHASYDRPVENRRGQGVQSPTVDRGDEQDAPVGLHDELSNLRREEVDRGDVVFMKCGVESAVGIVAADRNPVCLDGECSKAAVVKYAN